MNIDTKLYDTIFEKVKPLLMSGRPGDYAHIKSVYRSLRTICEQQRYPVNARVLIAAGILHDCGFGFLKKRYIRLFTGQEKVVAMKDVINELTLAFVPVCLRECGYSEGEIEAVRDIIRYSDEEVLSVSDPSWELRILHDLNLYDRFLPHRLRLLKKSYPDPEKVRMVLEKSFRYIILPEFKEKASRLMEQRV